MSQTGASPEAFGSGTGPAAVVAAAPQGPVRTLVLAGAGLALVVYLLGFVGDSPIGTFTVGPLVLAGGLLAAAVLVPRAGRLLIPAAVLATVGFLMLLQVAVVASQVGLGGIAIVTLVLVFLEAVALVGAVLLDSGLVAMPVPRQTPQPGGYGQPYGPGGYPPQGQGGGYVQQPQYGQYSYPPTGGFPQQPYGAPAQPPGAPQSPGGQAPGGQPQPGGQPYAGGQPFAGGSPYPGGQPYPGAYPVGQGGPGQPGQVQPGSGQQGSGQPQPGGQPSSGASAQVGQQGPGAPAPLWSAQTDAVPAPLGGTPATGAPTTLGAPPAGPRPSDAELTRVDGVPIPAESDADPNAAGRHGRLGDPSPDRTTRLRSDPEHLPES